MGCLLAPTDCSLVTALESRLAEDKTRQHGLCPFWSSSPASTQWDFYFSSSLLLASLELSGTKVYEP